MASQPLLALFLKGPGSILQVARSLPGRERDGDGPDPAAPYRALDGFFQPGRLGIFTCLNAMIRTAGLYLPAHPQTWKAKDTRPSPLTWLAPVA